MSVSIKVFSDGELIRSASTENAPGILGQPKTTKGDETSPGWTPAPVKDWDSRDGFSSNAGRPNSESKDTTPIGEATTPELARRLTAKLLQREGKVPKGIRQLLVRLLERD